MVRLLQALVSLCAFLPSVVTPYQIGVGCDNARVQGIVDDAVNLANRARLVLNEYLAGQAGPVGNGAVRNILTALVGSTAAGNLQTVASIRDRFTQLVQGVGGFGTGTANIVIHCQEVGMTRTYMPGPGQQPIPFYVHPVSMARIGGIQQQNAPSILFAQNAGQPYYFVPTVQTPATDKGYTFATEPGSQVLQNQQQYTGSTVAWSDVTLLRALEPNEDPDGINALADVTGWRPTALNTQDITLLDLGELPLITLIHELMHSTAIANPIAGHAASNGEDANNIAAIFPVAAANDPQAANNPETFAYLALALSMPWLKWWNNNPANPNGPPLADGRLYRAQYNLQPNPNAQGQFTQYIPRFFNAQQNLNVIMQQIARGPKAFS